MKKRALVITTLVTMMVVAMLGVPNAVMAVPCAQSTEGPTPSPGFTIDSVQPTTISNASSVTIVITGGAFGEGASAVLQGIGGLTTTHVSNSVLNAAVPAGINPGDYTLTVINDDGTCEAFGTPIHITGLGNTAVPSNTPAATNTPAPTNFLRPVLAVDSYGASASVITPGEDLDFELNLANWGPIQATNIVLTFTNADFAPRVTGGQRVINYMDPNQKVKVFQPLTASESLKGKDIATLEVKASYTDAAGTAYTETFNITFNVVKAATGGTGATSTPTATVTLVPRPQLLVKTYTTDVETLQPGQRFTLSFDVANSGAGLAKGITMIIGGGTVSGGSGGTGGTPGAGGGGGVSGAGGDFANFAPIGSSNVQSIGDIDTGATISLSQEFIVNATTKAGAYPMKISFAYTDSGGNAYNDDQAITLLVYAPPLIEITYYRPADPLFVGQPGQLPIQIVNKSRTTALLGNMTITSDNADLSNNTILIGSLDPGGSFPLDAVAIPFTPGPIEFTVTVDYVDDFNQPQLFTTILTGEVIDIPTPEPGSEGGGGEIPVVEPEGPVEMIMRFIAGFFGFDSAPPSNNNFGGGGEFTPIDPGISGPAIGG